MVIKEKQACIITSIHPGIAPNIALTLLVFSSKPFSAKIMSPGTNNENILFFSMT